MRSMANTKALAVSAFLASYAAGHPLFSGKVVSNVQDLLPVYDYVIVGAGASGLTVANRLSEDSSKSISCSMLLNTNMLSS